MRKILFGALAASLFLITGSVSAQTEGPEAHYRRGVELYRARKFGAAQAEFARALPLTGKADARLAMKLRYYDAMCAAELEQETAPALLAAFLQEYPNSIYNNDVRFASASLSYAKGEWSAARDALLAVNPFELPREEQDEYQFKLGHTLFMQEEYDKAYPCFRQVDAAGEYGRHALYHLSYIDYIKENYNAAREGFQKLQSDEAYAKVIPYYLLQIAFLQNDYDYVTVHGDALMQGTTDARAKEAARLLAEAWFHKGDYARTISYLDRYRELGGEMKRQELYLKGFSDYMEGYFAEAAKELAPVCAADDRLAQNASYHLADCYLRLGDKPRAMHSFLVASSGEWDEAIREDALFNYGKLQYELGGGVFNEAINVLTRYLKEYPDSPRRDQVQEYLIAAYYNSRNYEAAWEAISRIPDPDNNIRTAYQKIAYFRGLEFFNAGDLDNADRLLDLSTENRFNPKYTALTSFWKAEILCRKGEWEKAIPLYRSYIRLSPASEPENVLAHYNLGYCYFNLERWDEAREWFDKFLGRYKTGDRYRADTYNREGDILYAERSYWKAIEAYDRAIRLATDERFYAQFQRAVALGLVNRPQRKIETLQEIISAGEGDYVDDAMYELARTYIAGERFADGAAQLKRYIAKYPAGAYYTAALSDLGLVYQNLGDNAQALKYYKTVVEKAPSSPQAKDALLAIRGIYVDQNDVDAYFDFAKKTGIETDLTARRRDSLAYVSAERIYLTGDAARSSEALNAYLKNYPRGTYRPNALYYLSESLLRENNRAGAIGTLEELSSLYFNDFTVRGLEKLATLSFEEKEYPTSADAYLKLSRAATNPTTVAGALGGYLNAVEAQGDAAETLAAADRVLESPYTDADVTRRARYLKASVLEKEGKRTEALELYGMLAGESRTAEGAEATYRVIESLYDAGDTAEAEKRIFAFSEQNSPHTYWVARAFLLLGDIYAKAGDAFQARATYQSIVEGYSPADDGIVEAARERIKALK